MPGLLPPLAPEPPPSPESERSLVKLSVKGAEGPVDKTTLPCPSTTHYASGRQEKGSCTKMSQVRRAPRSRKPPPSSPPELVAHGLIHPNDADLLNKVFKSLLPDTLSPLHQQEPHLDRWVRDAFNGILLIVELPCTIDLYIPKLQSVTQKFLADKRRTELSTRTTQDQKLGATNDRISLAHKLHTLGIALQKYLDEPPTPARKVEVTASIAKLVSVFEALNADCLGGGMVAAEPVRPASTQTQREIRGRKNDIMEALREFQQVSGLAVEAAKAASEAAAESSKAKGIFGRRSKKGEVKSGEEGKEKSKRKWKLF